MRCHERDYTQKLLILDGLEDVSESQFGIHKPKIFSIEEADYVSDNITFDSFR